MKQTKPFDIKVRTFVFAKEIISISKELPFEPTAEVLRRQLVRSGTSVGSNVEEADGCKTRKDRANKLTVARKEAREVNYWLRLIKGDYLEGPDLDSLIDESSQLIRILSAMIVKLS